MGKIFEIIYCNGSVVKGTTVEEFSKAPDIGIQFLIVQYEDDSVIKHKAQDEYEYQGATKPGTWCDDYFILKNRLTELSTLLSGNPDTTRRRR